MLNNDVAIPDNNITATRIEKKICNYSELNVEIARLWITPEKIVKVIPVVIGVLGSIPLKFKYYVDQLDVKYTLGTLQKYDLWCTAITLRKVLSEVLALI